MATAQNGFEVALGRPENRCRAVTVPESSRKHPIKLRRYFPPDSRPWSAARRNAGADGGTRMMMSANMWDVTQEDGSASRARRRRGPR